MAKKKQKKISAARREDLAQAATQTEEAYAELLGDGSPVFSGTDPELARFGSEGGDIAGAVVGGIAVVGQIVMAGIAAEDQPNIRFMRALARWPAALDGLDRCESERAEALQIARGHCEWLKDKSRWKDWKKDDPSRRTGPGGCKTHKTSGSNCTPPVEWKGIVSEGFGGPAERSSDWSGTLPWPSSCAYKDALVGLANSGMIAADVKKGQLYEALARAKRIESEGGTGRLAIIITAPGIRNSGTITSFRRLARMYWEVLVGLEAYRQLLTNMGLILQLGPPTLFNAANLNKMYPPEDNPEFAASNNAGIAPYPTRNGTLSVALSLVGNGQISGETYLPNWVYGLTMAQQEAMGPVGPSLNRVQAFLDRRGVVNVPDSATGGAFLPGAGFSGVRRTRFGAAGGADEVVNVADSLRGWITQGAPSTWNGELLIVPAYNSMTDGLGGSDDGGDDDGEGWSTGTKIGIGVGGLLTVVGVTAAIMAAKKRNAGGAGAGAANFLPAPRGRGAGRRADAVGWADMYNDDDDCGCG